MYFVDYNKLDPQNLSVLAEIPNESDICILDLSEVERLWPLDAESGLGKYKNRVVYDITRTLENHKGKIYYICSDCNIYKRYEKWLMTDPKKEIDVYCMPFNDIPKVKIFKDFQYSYEEILKKTKGINEGWICHQKTLETYNKVFQSDKTKNFIVLTCGPKLIRLLFLDKFYQHENMEYSYFPYYHMNTSSSTDQIFSRDDLGHYDYSKFTIETPYTWSSDGQKIKTIGQIYVALEKTYINSRNQSLQNGFNFQDHVRELTEFLYEWKSNVINKNVFNISLPTETFSTCCDIVFETYVNSDSIFFTEKTWKEIIFRRPFLSFGAKTQQDTFRKLGFQLYDNVFDYEYDSLNTLEQRFDKFNTQIDYFLDVDTNDFNDRLISISDRIEHNFNHYVKQLDLCKWTLLLCKYKDSNKPIVEDNSIKFDKAVPELEYFKEILK